MGERYDTRYPLNGWARLPGYAIYPFKWFLIWPGATAIVVIVGFNLLNVDKLVLGVRVRGEQAAGRLGVVFCMALLAEAIYTSYWLVEKLFHWISIQEYT